MKTSRQQMTETSNNPAPHHAATIPNINAAVPEIGVCVASIMAGKVIMAKVTYGM